MRYLKPWNYYMHVNFEQLIEIEELIKEKKWEDLQNKNGNKINDIVFSLFEKVEDNEEYTLLKFLINNYFVCTDYWQHCFKIAENIYSVFFNEKIAIVPICDESSKIKSGHAIGYEVSAFLDKKKFATVEILESLDKIKENISDYSIIVIDDFIGSGSQFRKFVRRCEQLYNINTNNIYLYSIVMMNNTFLRINDFCYASFSIYNFPKALTDFHNQYPSLNHLDIYKRIESKIEVSKNYKRGYLRSEALVTMKKTPNNTLPIFWCEKAVNGQKWPAIFPRG